MELVSKGLKACNIFRKQYGWILHYDDIQITIEYLLLGNSSKVHLFFIYFYFTADDNESTLLHFFYSLQCCDGLYRSLAPRLILKAPVIHLFKRENKEKISTLPDHKSAPHILNGALLCWLRGDAAGEGRVEMNGLGLCVGGGDLRNKGREELLRG